MKTTSAPVYEFGDFPMDVAERQLLRRDGSAVPLTPRVFETLRYLVENSGSLLDKEVLMQALWPDCDGGRTGAAWIRKRMADSPE